MGCGGNVKMVKEEIKPQILYKLIIEKDKNIVFDNYHLNLTLSQSNKPSKTNSSKSLLVPKSPNIKKTSSKRLEIPKSPNLNNMVFTTQKSQSPGLARMQTKSSFKNLSFVETEEGKTNLLLVDKLNKENNFYIKQFVIGCLSQYSYYIESGEDCIVIDPMRDIEFYLKFISQRKTKLKYVVETHFHADFVSGHIELAQATGCKILFGPSVTDKINYQIYEAEDGDVIKLGKCSMKVIHTPGHTIESSSFLLCNENNIPKAIFTGDTLFLGEIGRPDMTSKSFNSKDSKSLIEQLYESIKKIKALDENVIIFPGHGPGSLCGKKINSGFCDSLKNQKELNKALDDKLTKQEFIEIIAKDIPTPPAYFQYCKSLNVNGHENMEDIIRRNKKELYPEEFLKLASKSSVAVIDTRKVEVFRKSYFHNSIFIPLNISFAVWVATLYDPATKLLLICDKGKEKESIVRLGRVGYHNVIGYLASDFQELQSHSNFYGSQIEFLSEIQAENFMLNKENIIVDVRESIEIANTGHIKNAKILYLSNIFNNLGEFKTFKKPIGIYCQNGTRAAITASILKKFNINNISVLGGFQNLSLNNEEIIDT